jgi:hypothetical protein
MNELQAGIELALAAFPESSAFLQPSEGAFGHPSLREDSKGCESLRWAICPVAPMAPWTALQQGLADIAAISQNTLRLLQISGRQLLFGFGSMRR